MVKSCWSIEEKVDNANKKLNTIITHLNITPTPSPTPVPTVTINNVTQ